MSLTRKVRTLFIIQVSIITVIAVAELLILHFSRRHASRIDQEIQKNSSQIEQLIKENSFALIHPTLSKFNAYKDYSEESYGKILSLLVTHHEKARVTSPLEFKEELLRIQKLLVERATLWDIKIPSAISFGEYEGGNIPSAQDVESLKAQLTIVRALVNYLIESRIAQLHEIKRNKPRSIKVAGKEHMYEIFPFQMSFDGKIEDLLKFLSKIYMSRELIIIRKIDISAQSEDRLSIFIDLDYIRVYIK